MVVASVNRSIESPPETYQTVTHNSLKNGYFSDKCSGRKVVYRSMIIVWVVYTVESLYSGHSIKRTSLYDGHCIGTDGFIVKLL